MFCSTFICQTFFLFRLYPRITAHPGWFHLTGILRNMRMGETHRRRWKQYYPQCTRCPGKPWPHRHPQAVYAFQFYLFHPRTRVHGILCDGAVIYGPTCHGGQAVWRMNAGAPSPCGAEQSSSRGRWRSYGRSHGGRLIVSFFTYSAQNNKQSSAEQQLHCRPVEADS